MRETCAPPNERLLLGAYQALERQIAAKKVTMHERTEMLDLVIINGQARGIISRNMVTGEITKHVADCVIMATGGYSNFQILPYPFGSPYFERGFLLQPVLEGDLRDVKLSQR